MAGGLLVGDPQNQLAIQFATRHINFRSRARRRCFRTEPDTTEPHGLMMFATKPRPSRRRYCRATLSWSTRTPSNFASIAPSSGRQHDPQHEAGMWKSRVLDQLAVLDATNSQSCVSYMKTKYPCFPRRLFRHGRPPTCSPAPLCHVEFRTRARCGVILGSVPIAVCDLGPLVGLFVPTSQRKSHFRPPSPLRACERLGSM